MTSQAPAIAIHIDKQGELSVKQHRPALTSLLSGLAIDLALEQIPTLLPICGRAQSIAAERAVSAARGEAESPGEQDSRNQALIREQAMAAGWRLAIDWPELVQQPRQLETLGRMHRASSAEEMRGVLFGYLGGLAEVDSLSDLREWVTHSATPAAELIRHALAADAQALAPAQADQRVAGEALQSRSIAALAAEPFDSLAPSGPATEVGPQAMARDPMIPQLDEPDGFGPLSARLLAQLLDTRYIADMLQAGQIASSHYPSARQLGEHRGLGCAITARGPVFHQVSLAADAVVDWRVIAPTDWHLSTCGPIASAAAGRRLESDWVRVLVAGFDPCAPWQVSEAQAHA